MSDPERQQVRVRRSPKIGVFLALGAIVGAVAAIIAGSAAPQDAATPREQGIGFLLLVLAPLGAVLGGAIALLLDRIADRRARTVEAERIVPALPQGAGAADRADAADQTDLADQAGVVAEPDVVVQDVAVQPEQTDRS